MADETLAGYKAKYTAIDKRLDAGLTDAERPAVKVEIVTLFKSVEQQIAELSTLKDEIKQLVERGGQAMPVRGVTRRRHGQ